MADFLLALAFVITLLFGYWIMSRLKRYLDSLKIDTSDTDIHDDHLRKE